MTEENAQQSTAVPASNLRNRLVGSVILVAAAVIIIPSVLDGQKVSYKDDFKNVPERAEFKAVPSAKPFPKKEFEQHLPKEELPVTDEQPIDADELEAQALSAQSSNENNHTVNEPEEPKEVLNNGTIVVNTLAKPQSFDNKPGVASQAQKRGTEKPAVQKQASKPVAKKTSPFTSNAWVIQLGVFGNKANVAALEKRLNDAGFATFNRDVRYKNGKVLTKVFVGPELDKSVLSKSLPKVNKLAGVTGKIANYSVNN